MRAEEELLRIANELKRSAQKLKESAAVHEAASEDLKEIAESRALGEDE